MSQLVGFLLGGGVSCCFGNQYSRVFRSRGIVMTFLSFPETRHNTAEHSVFFPGFAGG